jgi:hypothetical protein
MKATALATNPIDCHICIKSTVILLKKRKRSKSGVYAR